MHFSDSLRMIDPDTLMSALCGASPEIIANRDFLADFSHGLEAMLAGAKENARGSMCMSELGASWEQAFDLDEGAISVIRRRLLGGVYRAVAMARAQEGDCSRDFLAEAVESSEKIVLVGEVSAFRSVLEQVEADFIADLNPGHCMVSLAPREAGSPCGFEASLVTRETLRKNIVCIIDDALSRGTSDQRADPLCLVKAGETDLSPALGAASQDERQRLEALLEQQMDGKRVAGSLRHRGLVEGMLSRAEDRLSEMGFGSVRRDPDGAPVAWHYSSREDRALEAALVPLLGDRDYDLQAPADALCTSVKVIHSGDSLMPEIVILPSSAAGELGDIVSATAPPLAILHDGAHAESLESLGVSCPIYAVVQQEVAIESILSLAGNNLFEGAPS